MNTKIIIGLVVVVILGGGFLYFKKGAAMKLPGSESTAFTSISDALSKSVSLECSFTDEDGRQTKTYIKNGAVRADYTASVPSESGSMIFKDKTMYSWSGDKQGFKMTIPDAVMEEGKETAEDVQSEGVSGYKDILAGMEKFKDSCKPAVVADSVFTPPIDVTFTDYSEMMKSIPAMPEGKSDEYPAMDKEQLEQIMKQYGAPEDSDE